MYCVKCGVELADSEKKCPLCQTPVYFPELDTEAERPYPKYEKSNEELSPRGVHFIVTVLFVIAAVIQAICDISLNGEIVWSGIVFLGLAFIYILFVLPKWFWRPSPAVFVPVDFAALALLLMYIDFVFKNDSWFLTFALPVLGFFALIVTAVCVLCYYLRCGYLYIAGGAFCLLAFFTVFVEWMIHLNFEVIHKNYWSVYPFVALLLIGIMLIVVAIVPRFRDSIRKKFTI
jgi:hypothetical protein